ncbi:MAG: hypothetical protein ACOCXQ_04175 [Patescibacteria group bacterium]
MFNTSGSKKPNQNKKPPVQNRFETEDNLKGYVEHAAREVAQVPVDIAQDIKHTGTDLLVGAFYGLSPEEMRARRQEQEQMKKSGYTPLDYDKLRKAQRAGDMAEVQRIQEEMQQKAQKKQEHQSAHKARQSEEERVQHQLKQQEMQRKKEEEEEEMRKKQEEEEERRQQAEMDPSAGAGKQKAKLGQAKQKAKVETNFEASKGRTGK